MAAVWTAAKSTTSQPLAHNFHDTKPTGRLHNIDEKLPAAHDRRKPGLDQKVVYRKDAMWRIQADYQYSPGLAHAVECYLRIAAVTKKSEPPP